MRRERHGLPPAAWPRHEQMDPQVLPHELDERIVSHLERWNRAALEVVMFVAGVTLLAWLVPPFGELFPAGWQTMKANAALGMLLASASLWLSRPGMSSRAVSWSLVPASLLTFVASASAAEHLTGVDLGIGALLADDPYADPPGRMSLQSVVGFVLLSPVLFLMRASRPRWSIAADALTLALAAYILVVLAGYLFDAAGFLRIAAGRDTSPVALGCFALLAIVIALRRAQYGLFAVLIGAGIGSRIARGLLPVVMALPFVLAIAQRLSINHGWLSAGYATALFAAAQSFVVLCIVLWLAWRLDFFERELRAISLVDELTGVNNRRGFFLLGGQSLSIARRQHQHVTIFFFDLDGLKQINDTWGHEAGSAFIADVAVLLKSTFRESDVIGRLGGDEFGVVAISQRGQTTELLGRIEEGIAHLNRRTDRPYKVALSIGHAEMAPGSEESLEEVLARADAMMYAQKRLRKAGQETDKAAGKTV